MKFCTCSLDLGAAAAKSHWLLEAQTTGMSSSCRLHLASLVTDIFVVSLSHVTRLSFRCIRRCRGTAWSSGSRDCPTDSSLRDLLRFVCFPFLANAMPLFKEKKRNCPSAAREPQRAAHWERMECRFSNRRRPAWSNPLELWHR